MVIGERIAIAVVQHCTQQLLLPKDRKMQAKILLLFWQIME
mgnify:CR=1 FL=1